MRTSAFYYPAALLAVALTACGPDDFEYNGVPVNFDTCLGVAATETNSITSDDILQARWPWTVTDGTGETVPLHAGTFTRTSPPEARLTVKVTGCQWADLDGDGLDEVAVLVSENFGGSGTFLSLHVLDTLNGEMFGLAPAALGDRVFPYDFAVVGRVVRVGMLAHTEDDPYCCPSVETTRRFMVRDFAVVPVGDAAAGGEAQSTTPTTSRS